MKRALCRDFLGGPLAKIPHSQCSGGVSWGTRSRKPHLRPSTIKQKKNLCCRLTMMLSGQWPAQGTCFVVCYQHLQLASQFSSARLIVEAPDVVISPLCPLSCLCCTLIHTDLFKISLSSSYYWAVSTTLILLCWVLPIAVCVGHCAEQDQHSILFLFLPARHFQSPFDHLRT